MKTRPIGILGFDGVMALDVVGPADVFAAAAGIELKAGRPLPYEVVMIGVTGRPFSSESGLVLKPAAALGEAPPLDTIVVPGGSGLREPRTNRCVTDWVKARAGHTRRVASVCTGIYGIAPTGLLDGRRVTTHWEFADAVSLAFPKVRMEPDAIFVKDGKFYTSAGVTAGIDLCMEFVKEDLGPAVALAVARELVVYLVRTGGQEQFSAPLQFQASSSDRFSEIASWIAGHLRDDLSVEVLAARASVCARHFTRRFKRDFGCTPAAFVEDLRLDEARRLLSSGPASIESVSGSAGFGSPDSFRRAFERRFGIPPKTYRGRFNPERSA